MPERQRLIAGYLEQMRIRRNKKYSQKAAAALSDNKRRTHTLIISCFESCPGPERIFEFNPGEVLVHTEVAALVAPYDSKRSMDPYGLLAKLEYAVNHEKIRNLIVLGNTASKCLDYMMVGVKNEALSGWLEIAHNAIERAYNKHNSLHNQLIRREILHQTVLQSVRNLLTYPVVYQAVKRGELTLNAWYYHPEEDRLYAYNHETEMFEIISLKVTNHEYTGVTQKASQMRK